MPSAAQIEGLVRTVLMLGTGFVIKWGIDEGSWAVITGAIVSLAGVAWSLFVNTQAQLIKEVAKDPDVKEIVVEGKDLADSIPSDKVVPA